MLKPLTETLSAPSKDASSAAIPVAVVTFSTTPLRTLIRPRNNNFVDDNAKSVTGPNVFVPNNAVAELTTSGGQFNTSLKSGSNLFQGQVYEYFLNRDLNAVDQSFANQGIYPNLRCDQNRLGGNFGGPAIKNKLFFFNNFEYNPLGRSSTVGSPVCSFTSAGYSTLGSIAGVDQTNLGILKTYVTAANVTSGCPSVTVNGTRSRYVSN